MKGSLIVISVLLLATVATLVFLHLRSRREARRSGRSRRKRIRIHRPWPIQNCRSALRRLCRACLGRGPLEPEVLISFARARHFRRSLHRCPRPSAQRLGEQRLGSGKRSRPICLRHPRRASSPHRYSSRRRRTIRHGGEGCLPAHGLKSQFQRACHQGRK